jgi:hypothetical protein
MGTYALVKNGTVTNVIVADAAHIAAIGAQYDHIAEVSGTNVSPGWTWDGNAFSESTVIEADPPWKWYIDIGPFVDRMGSARIAVLTSTDPTVKALVQDFQMRKWIDLQNAQVSEGLAYIGSVVTSVTPALQAQILTTPVQLTENLALRKLYFS